MTAAEDDPPDRFGGPFGIIPAWVLSAKHDGEPLTGSDLRVYFALRTFANRSGDCWPKLKTLAERASTSLASTKRAVAKFTEMGIVEITHQHRDDGSLRASKYHLTDVSPIEPSAREVDDWREADRALFVEVMGQTVTSLGVNYNEGRFSALKFYEEFRTRNARKGKGTKFRWPGRFVDSLEGHRMEEWLEQEGIDRDF